MSDQSANSEQKHGTRWRPGQSGNPQGRPQGSRSKVLIALDGIGNDAARDVLAKTIDLAKAGDLRAAGLILSRVWPARKGRAVALDLPPIRAASDLPAAIGAVVQAVATGELSPEEGQAIAAILEGQRRAIETADLARRIEALEHAR